MMNESSQATQIWQKRTQKKLHTVSFGQKLLLFLQALKPAANTANQWIFLYVFLYEHDCFSLIRNFTCSLRFVYEQICDPPNFSLCLIYLSALYSLEITVIVV